MRKDDSNKFIFSSKDTAEFFGVDTDTISLWAKKGAPKEGRGRWDLKKLMEWRYGGGHIKESPEVRKLKAEADLKEIKKEQEKIKLAVTEGRYIPVTQVTKDLFRVFGAVKNKLLSIGHKVANEINGFDQESAVTANRVIDDVIHEALEDMAKGGIYVKGKK